jgi:hypothetical protein
MKKKIQIALYPNHDIERKRDLCYSLASIVFGWMIAVFWLMSIWYWKRYHGDELGKVLLNFLGASVSGTLLWVAGKAWKPRISWVFFWTAGIIGFVCLMFGIMSDFGNTSNF